MYCSKQAALNDTFCILMLRHSACVIQIAWRHLKNLKSWAKLKEQEPQVILSCNHTCWRWTQPCQSQIRLYLHSHVQNRNMCTVHRLQYASMTRYWKDSSRVGRTVPDLEGQFQTCLQSLLWRMQTPGASKHDERASRLYCCLYFCYLRSISQNPAILVDVLHCKQVCILCICSSASGLGSHLVVVGVANDHLSRVGIPVSMLHSNMTKLSWPSRTSLSHCTAVIRLHITLLPWWPKWSVFLAGRSL